MEKNQEDEQIGLLHQRNEELLVLRERGGLVKASSTTLLNANQATGNLCALASTELSKMVFLHDSKMTF